MSSLPGSVRQLLPRLRDPEFTKILIVTLAEATPVHEAAQLQKDLARARIKPFGWVINQALVPLQLTDPVLAAKKTQQRRYVHEVVQEHADVVAIVPWMADDKTNTAVLAAQRTLKSSKITLGLYTLPTRSPDYPAISAQVQAPAILVACKGKGMAAVSGDVTEAKLLQAFVATSRAGGCGPSGCGPSGGACN
jgi:hypothetical protein